MNFIYLIPFAYFLDTRLRHSSFSFHAVFEWMAALVLVLSVSSMAAMQALVLCGLSYFAFICLYEIGYLVNDLVSSKKEEGGRKRGPKGESVPWLALWIFVRLLVFSGITVGMGKLAAFEWWSFFVALGLVFSLHNILTDRELKAATFLWLSWFRFMAPVIFIVDADQRLGVALAAAMGYSVFRLFGYLDSKGLLQMPGRQRPEFRWLFFLMALAGAIALFPYGEARGFIILSGFFAAAATLGVTMDIIRQNYK